MVEKLKTVISHSFMKFAVVGFIGTITNLSIFFVCVDIFKLWVNPVAVSAFLLVGVQNYVLHHKWTFIKHTRDEELSFYGWLKFIVTTLLGLGISIIVLNLILHFYSPQYKVMAQFCGVAFGTIFNYLGSRYFVFKKR